MKRFLVLIFAAAILALTFASPALAGVGLQTGLSLDPDNWLIGAHWKSKPLGDTSMFWVPSVEAGFGDVTMVAGNFDLHYDLKGDSKLYPYIGGGATLNWFDTGGDDDLEFGGSILGGLQLSPKMYFEAKLGLGDVPDWKFLLGWHAK